MMNKNKFKKIAALACTAALTGVLAFSLTACGDNNDNNNGDGGDNTNTTQTALQLNKSTVTVKVGATDTVQVTSATTSAVTWTSSDPTVATVKGGGNGGKLGTVTGVKEGSATITAKAGDYEATCTVTVTAADDVGGGKDDLGDPTDIPYSESVIDGWSHWVAGSGEGDISLSKMCTYGTGANTQAHVTYSATWGAPYGLQLRYNDKYTGVVHDTSLTIVSPVNAKIMVNGEEKAVTVGDNAIEVKGYSAQTLFVQFGSGAWTDDNQIVHGVNGASISFIIKDIVITSTAQQLATPSFTYDATSKKVTVTDSNDSAKVGGYQLGFFESATATTPKTTVDVAEDGTFSLKSVANGDYVVKIRATGVDSNFINSEWSTGSIELTVSNDTTAITTDSTDGWYYWANNNGTGVTSAYLAANGDIHLEGVVGNSGSTYDFQLKLDKAVTHIKMTVRATKAGYIGINAPNKNYELVAVEGQDYFEAVIDDDCTGSNVIICLGSNQDPMFGQTSNNLTGDILFYGIEITYAN